MKNSGLNINYEVNADESQAKNTFVFDKNKCVGCGACAVACMNENGFQLTDQWRNISNSNTQHFPGLPLFYLSLACNHCDDAPCMKNCPALAYSRDEDTGAIIHHADKCIGCKYCTWACPYDAPKYNPNLGVVEKCTFCNHRISEGEKPVCAQLCPTGALDFQKLQIDRESSDNSSPVPVSIGANFKSIELRNTSGPEIDKELFEDVKIELIDSIESKIDAKKEWPLLIFTLLATALVSIKSTRNEFFTLINDYYLIAAGLLAAVLSTLHLGKKFRAWRSILNQNSSWLSREILVFTLFLGLLLKHSFVVEVSQVLFAFIGFILLFSIDKLYSLAMWNWKIKIHSAQTLLIAASLITLLMSLEVLFLIVAVLRISLYIFRGLTRKKRLAAYRVARVMLLLIATFTLFYQINFWIVLLVFTLGEIIDRIEFYNELEVPIPQNEINSTK